MLRDSFKDVSMQPDRYLGKTEEHGVRRLDNGERWPLAIRMLQRITIKQERARLNVHGPDW
eukprot:5472089-Alexandrium_andersonii.AAC.1